MKLDFCRSLLLGAATAALVACADSPTISDVTTPEVAIVRSGPSNVVMSGRVIEEVVLWTGGNALAINDAGVVVGYQLVGGVKKFVRWEKGVITSIPGMPDAFQPYSLGMDETMLGTIDGRPAIWNGTQLIQPPLPPQYSLGWTHVTPSGAVAGTVVINNFFTPVKWDGSVLTNLGTVAGPGGNLTDMNKAGQIVGVSTGAFGARAPWIWENGVLKALPLPPGYASGYVFGINEDGVAVGFASNPTFAGVIWRDGNYEVIPWPRAVGIFPEVIGDNNQVVFREVGYAPAQWILFNGTDYTPITAFDYLTGIRAVNRHGVVIGNRSSSQPGGAAVALMWRDKPLDNTPPVITASVAGTKGLNEWFVSDVTIAWDVSDSESAVTSPACAPTTIVADTPEQIVSCSASSSGGTATSSVTVKRDTGAPLITFSGARATYAVNENIAISCSVTDATSGVNASSCPSVNVAAYTLGVGSHTLSASATDFAGLSASSSISFTVVVTSAGMSSLIDEWVTNTGVAKSLNTKLDAIVSARGASRDGKIQAFVNEVEAQSGKSISAQQAAALIEMARSL